MEVRAACWARRGAMADMLEACVVWICCVRVWEMAQRSASFCGLGGIGGGSILFGWVGRVVSKGEVSKSSGGLCFGSRVSLAGYSW